LAVLEHTGRRSLTVDRGEIVSVLGAPGSGKTQLALELAFLARPREGEVLLHGKPGLPKRSMPGANQRPREVTMLVQNAEDQLFARTVFDDVAFGPRHLNLDTEEIDDRVERALSAVRLEGDVRERSPFALSGGERRRVALAGVLAMEPEVLILDEPTANLDPRTRNEFNAMLEPLRHRSAIVWFTASAREAALADRIYLLKDGQTEEIGGAAELLKNWRSLAGAGVELPALYELAGILATDGYRLPETADAAALEQAIVHGWKDRHDR